MNRIIEFFQINLEEKCGKTDEITIVSTNLEVLSLLHVPKINSLVPALSDQGI